MKEKNCDRLNISSDFPLEGERKLLSTKEKVLPNIQKKLKTNNNDYKHTYGKVHRNTKERKRESGGSLSLTKTVGYNSWIGRSESLTFVSLA